VRFLVDTNVIGELRKGARCDANVARWFEGVEDDDLYIGVVTLGELRYGIERARRRDPQQALALERWLDRIERAFDDRILPVDRQVADVWGRINVPDPLPTADALLAATAKVHGLTLATRNVRDIVRTGVSYLNPFEPAGR
jgi:toxin FitB